MPIVPSRARHVQTLVRQLSSERVADRESAVAQLTLLGARAVEPLLTFLPQATSVARLAALEVIERIDDPRALPTLLSLAADPDRRVALRAIEMAGRAADARAVPTLAKALAGPDPSRREAAAEWLARLHTGGLVEALSPLVDLLVDEEAEGDARLAVLDALVRSEPPLPRSVSRPLRRRLATSHDPRVAARAADLDPSRRSADAPRDVVDRLRRGEVSRKEARALATSLKASREIPLDRLHQALQATKDPRAVRSLAVVLGAVGGPSSVTILANALERLGEGRRGDEEREDVLEARADLHSALAALDSGLALHDLRELIARHPAPVMAQLLDAARRVGNPTFVPALARAASEDPAWLEACGSTYATIARRARLRRSSAALRRVRAEHRPALGAFLTAAARGRR